MKLSTKGRYGLRAMVDLAVHYSEGHITLGKIAQTQYVSESYLEQLLTTLRKAGLVNSTRGHQGGYALAMDPKEITVAMVIEILEGSLAPVHCVDECAPVNCKRFDICATKNVWKKVRDSIYDVINLVSLKELADEQTCLNKLELDKVISEDELNSECGMIVIKNAKEEINNIAFNGKWLIKKVSAYSKTHGQEMLFSIALTEKNKIFVLFENEEAYENNGYTILSSVDELEDNDFLPHEIINLVKLSLRKEESVKFLDI